MAGILKFGKHHKVKKGMELNNKEKEAAYYDEIFRKGGKNGLYHRRPEGRTGDMSMWVAALREIGDQAPIFEFGCGTGQFAQLAIETGNKYTCGIDFSAEAIRQCKERLPEVENKLAIYNLYDPSLYTSITDENVVVLLEVLEHLANDFFPLENLPTGTKVIFSVPRFEDPSHVRKFLTEKEIEERYNKLIDIKAIHQFGKRYLAVGYRR